MLLTVRPVCKPTLRRGLQAKEVSGFFSCLEADLGRAVERNHLRDSFLQEQGPSHREPMPRSAQKSPTRQCFKLDKKTVSHFSALSIDFLTKH